jgi:hypothetical protein
LYPNRSAGIPLVYQLDHDMNPIRRDDLADPDAIAAATIAVAPKGQKLPIALIVIKRHHTRVGLHALDRP